MCLTWMPRNWGLDGCAPGELPATEQLLESAFSTQFVALSLVVTFGIAAPNVAAAAFVSTAGALVATLHMLGMRSGFAHQQEALLKGLNRVPWGGLAVALAPLPAVWAFVSHRFLAPAAWMTALLLPFCCLALGFIFAAPEQLSHSSISFLLYQPSQRPSPWHDTMEMGWCP